VLGIYVSGSFQFEISEGSVATMPTTGEWFGLIAYGVNRIRFEPWVFLSVAACFIIMVAIIQFLLAQIKKGAYPALRDPVQ